ncbi:sensor histidine kinase [Chitinophaga vietnamensis]|uniref:sensor histidine kinase n=1 Tax=Chitinophaga vietnamensis TaxID=2593957 RepID=UPI00117795F2|nr:ATP-binding protein [Chitinophaga vietnamensis]
MEQVTTRQLQAIEEIGNVPEDQLQWLIDNSECLLVPQGDIYFRAGDPAEFMVIVLGGRARVYAVQNNEQREILMMEAPSITGVLPFSRMKKTLGTCEVLEDLKLLRFPVARMSELIHHHYELTQALVHVMTNRVRTFTSQQQQNEKMMALGKLSAGLAHELNNPAAAVVRGAVSLKNHLQLVPAAFKQILSMDIPPDDVDAVNKILFEMIAQGPVAALSMMERSEREDALTDWLDAHHINNALELAENLVDFGFTVAHLEQVHQHVPEKFASPVFNWINNNLITEKMVTDIEAASRRIADLVGSVKTFTHMDQGHDKQFADIHSGIHNTLVMLQHKLRKGNITVKEQFDTTLPPVNAHIGELNQVWTNIIDNAIDAMEANGKGTLEIITRKDGHNCVAVDIIDDGPGIPPDIIDRIFDPFFTTKAIGQGTGLGLDITSQIVKRQHKGNLKVSAVPGRTQFTVALPING